MPELPEVETTCRGISPHITGKSFQKTIIRHHQLRWPIPDNLPQLLQGKKILQVERRAKYLLIKTRQHTLIIHLGMSGSFYITHPESVVEKHDHVDFIFDKNTCLRYTDPRRFGAILLTDQPIDQHPLFTRLGPEPLGTDFNPEYLHQRSRNRKTAIKNFIMDAKVIAGVGNIYASESLFMAHIHPACAAGKISKKRYSDLVSAIQDVLQKAIKAGGTTLRDFVNGEKKPGYFSQQLQVYGRAGEPCPVCQTTIKQLRQGQRSSFYCPHCQH
ncbi:MAG: bifunctional DNA-formamidopyrimidine glycosylase/DNA-(apurinic or apyrimidinic site) lyase [Gammaproteobacteria bacterium]|nr:bifunctional DNA-formamidopyrimidine glycosylase/DNA-(apurinic or apyrimidinic site) lyase [Gammaproteobacteria bacterium]